MPARETTSPSADRFAGCLLGQCLGDALGFVVEGDDPAACRRYVADHLSAGAATMAARRPFRPGQYTDDSQLARELTRSLVERRGFDAADYAKRVAAIFSSDRIVGRGRTTEAAARRLAQGVPWDRAGTPAPNAGNGSAMRAAPIGLLFHDDPKGLVAAAHDQGRITHADPRSSAGAVAVAGAVALALAGRSEPKSTIRQLVEWTRPIDRSFAAELKKLADWLALPPDQAGPEIARAGATQDSPPCRDGIAPFVTPSVIWSLYAYMKSPGDYLETLRIAIEVGGDVDTTAAMAGAISGAALGLDAVPEALRRQVHDRGAWAHDDLLRLAHELHALTAG